MLLSEEALADDKYRRREWPFSLAISTSHFLMKMTMASAHASPLRWAASYDVSSLGDNCAAHQRRRFPALINMNGQSRQPRRRNHRNSAMAVARARYEMSYRHGRFRRRQMAFKKRRYIAVDATITTRSEYSLVFCSYDGAALKIVESGISSSKLSFRRQQ